MKIECPEHGPEEAVEIDRWVFCRACVEHFHQSTKDWSEAEFLWAFSQGVFRTMVHREPRD